MGLERRLPCRSRCCKARLHVRLGFSTGVGPRLWREHCKQVLRASSGCARRRWGGRPRAARIRICVLLAAGTAHAGLIKEELEQRVLSAITIGSHYEPDKKPGRSAAKRWMGDRTACLAWREQGGALVDLFLSLPGAGTHSAAREGYGCQAARGQASWRCPSPVSYSAAIRSPCVTTPTRRFWRSTIGT